MGVVRYRCRDVTGKLRDIALTDRGKFSSPGSALEQRLVVANNVTLVRKFVSVAAGERNPWLYDLLDNEIRAGTRLGQVFPYNKYPPQLARLVAYDMDAEEPFVLLNEYLGEEAEGPASRFEDPQRKRFEIGLLRALQLIAAAGVVHGAVSMDTVRWDNGLLQLVDFEHAERAGEPRRSGGGSPVRSPEQHAGSGVVDVRDDIWAAGRLIGRLYLGALMDGARPDPSHYPERLRGLLLPMLGPVEQRPHPSELLGRLPGVDSSTLNLNDPEADLAQGRRRFEEASKRKRKIETVAPAAETAPTIETAKTADTAPQRGRRSWRLPFFSAMVLVAALIVGLAEVLA